jgi:hypothetical protein
MVHPFERSDKLPLMEFNLKICILYKGKLFGPAVIQYEDKDNKGLSFNGVGIFTNGKLHKGPFFCVTESNHALLFSMMINGRPANSYYGTLFFNDKVFSNVN